MQAGYDIKTVKFWSDGLASQFWSQFAFFRLSKLDQSINIEWNYFEANHGKGVIDGIGGTVKHAVYSYVLTNRIVIKSPEQFIKYANEIFPKTTVQYVENESIELGYLSECQEKAKKVKGTLKVHCIKRFMQNSTWNIIQGMDRKEILNSSPDKFLIPVYKIYLYATLPPRRLYHL